MNSTANFNALSPEHVIDLIKVTEPKEMIRVRGKVTRLSPYPRDNPYCFYGTLETIYGDGSIEFKCPKDAAPGALHQCVVIEGTVTSAPFKFQKSTGMEITLNGRCVGSAELPQTPGIVLRPQDRTQSKCSLKKYLQNNKLGGFGIIGSDTALTDIKSTMQIEPEELKFMRAASLVDIEKIISLTRELAPSAILFTRGGDDTTLSLWDQPEFIAQILDLKIPFYTALGHSHRLTLADHYADQAFLTPSDFGKSFYDIILEIHESRELRDALSKTEEENKILEIDISVKQSNHQSSLSSLKNDLQYQQNIVRAMTAQKKKQSQQLLIWKSLVIALIAVCGLLVLYLIFFDKNEFYQDSQARDNIQTGRSLPDAKIAKKKTHIKYSPIKLGVGYNKPLNRYLLQGKYDLR